MYATQYMLHQYIHLDSYIIQNERVLNLFVWRHFKVLNEFLMESFDSNYCSKMQLLF